MLARAIVTSLMVIGCRAGPPRPASAPPAPRPSPPPAPAVVEPQHDTCATDAECKEHTYCLTAEQAQPRCGEQLVVPCPDGSQSDDCGRCAKRCSADATCGGGLICRDNGTCTSGRSCRPMPIAMP